MVPSRPRPPTAAHRRHERPLLRRYHEALGPEISRSHGWDALLADYRLGHLQNVYVLIFQQQAGLPPSVWWPHLERWFLAFADLDCARLL